MKCIPEGQLFAILLFYHFIILVIALQCESPQYITLGQQGIIRCPFPSLFTTIAWTDSANETATHVIKIESQENSSPIVSGDGHDSGAYDILPDGSLIIQNATIDTDRTFRVFLVYKNASYTYANVVVKTIFFSNQSVPTVSSCGADDHCFVNLMDTDTLNCTYSGARPPVKLTWYAQHNNENEILNAKTATFSDSDYTFTSTSTLDRSDVMSNSLNVFVCEATGPALGFQEVIRNVFVYELGATGDSSMTQREKMLNDTLELSCTNEESPTVFIWSFERQGNVRVLVTSSEGETKTIDSLNESYKVSQDGKLKFLHVDDQLAGTFTCTFLAAGKSSINRVSVTIIDEVAPDGGSKFPVFIIIIIIFLIILIVVLFCFAFWYRKHKQSTKNEREYDAVAKEPSDEVHEVSPPRDEEEFMEMKTDEKTAEAAEEASLHSSTNEKESPTDDVIDIPNDPNEGLPNSEEDCPPDNPPDETEDPTNINIDSPEEEQGAPESRTVVGATLSSWRLKVDHEDQQVDSIEDLAKGDHIVISGWALHPRCHGIVVDTNIARNEIRLVRFTYKNGVVEEWKHWKPPIYKVLKYYIADKTLTTTIFDPDTVVERARKMLNNTNLKYNIGANNCKTFARWCKTYAAPAGYGYD